ncbi:MAG: hypothetical protein H7835_18590 [Magnetococcus sp. XQGC-1]
MNEVKVMSRKDAVDAFWRGEVLLVAEWRQVNVEAVSMRDRKSGAMRQTCVARHGCETDSGQVSVTEWYPDGTIPANVVVPWKKGDKVVIQVRGIALDRGISMVNGTINRLGSL